MHVSKISKMSLPLDSFSHLPLIHVQTSQHFERSYLRVAIGSLRWLEFERFKGLTLFVSSYTFQLPQSNCGLSCRDWSFSFVVQLTHWVCSSAHCGVWHLCSVSLPLSLTAPLPTSGHSTTDLYLQSFAFFGISSALSCTGWPSTCTTPAPSSHGVGITGVLPSCIAWGVFISHDEMSFLKAIYYTCS